MVDGKCLECRFGLLGCAGAITSLGCLGDWWDGEGGNYPPVAVRNHAVGITAMAGSETQDGGEEDREDGKERDGARNCGLAVARLCLESNNGLLV